MACMKKNCIRMHSCLCMRMHACQMREMYVQLDLRLQYLHVIRTQRVLGKVL